MKRILYLWIFIALLLVGTLTFLGFNITKKDKVYKNAENDIKVAAEGYAGYYPTILKNNLIITNDELIDKKFNEKIVIFDEKCDGYVLVKKQGGIYKYIPYIKCKNYTTKGYKSQK